MQSAVIRKRGQPSSRSSSCSFHDILEALDPARYFERIGVPPYEWQAFVLDRIAEGARSIVINGARQGGKSTIVSGLPVWIQKHEPRTSSLVFATSERQSRLDIEKALDYVRRDRDIVVEALGADHIAFAGGGEMIALPSNERTIRGHSKPRVLILDEAARMDDSLVFGISPMLVDNPTCVEILVSTPAGKRGAFWRIWQDPSWLRVEVRAPWDIGRVKGELAIVPAEPEEAYRERRAREGIAAFYSPRHRDKAFMERELRIMGERWMRQEYLCEFVEAEDSAFSYDDIDGAFQAGRALAALFGPRLATTEPLFGGAA
jgi:hypothetical protein